MDKSKTSHVKRDCSGGAGETMLVDAGRLPKVLMSKIDRWRQKREISRSEAIRRLIELGLSLEGRPAMTSRAAMRAAELAEDAVEARLAEDLPADEKSVRKRRLLQGPSSFRGVRKDSVK